MTKKILIGAAIIAVIALIVWKNSTREDGDYRKAIPVQIEEVRTKTINQVVSATGNIKPVVEVNLSANVSAEILEITVEEGMPVSAGQKLVVLDNLNYVAAVKQSRSALNAARASLSRVRSEYSRAQQLVENNLISTQEFEALEASLQMHESDVEQALARLEQSEDDLRKTELKAPIDGTVTSVRKEQGEMALGSMFQADVILTISDLTAMEVVVSVDETDVVSISQGNPVEVEIDALPDILLKGSVTQIAQSAQAALVTGNTDQVIDYEVQILVDMSTMDSRIRPGMSATANITTAISEDVVAIPIQALTARPENERPARRKGESKREESGKESIYDKEKDELIDVVFVVNTDSEETTGFSLGKKKTRYRVERRPVTVGISSANFYEVISGLDAGEMLVIGNYKAISKELKDGSLVEKKSSDRRDTQKNAAGENN